MTSGFLEKIIRHQPGLIGCTVYFCTKKKGSLPCILRGNGTISPISAPEKEYRTATALIRAIISGEIAAEGFSMYKKAAATKLSFSDDLYLRANRKELLRAILHDKVLVSSHNFNRATIFPFPFLSVVKQVLTHIVSGVFI